MTLGKKALVAGGAFLFAKAVLLVVLVATGAMALEAPLVLGIGAELLIGFGIIRADLIEARRSG